MERDNGVRNQGIVSIPILSRMIETGKILIVDDGGRSRAFTLEF